MNNFNGVEKNLWCVLSVNALLFRNFRLASLLIFRHWPGFVKTQVKTKNILGHALGNFLMIFSGSYAIFRR